MMVGMVEMVGMISPTPREVSEARSVNPACEMRVIDEGSDNLRVVAGITPPSQPSQPPRPPGARNSTSFVWREPGLLSAFYAGWSRCFGAERVTVSQAIERADTGLLDVLRIVARGNGGAVSTRRLGKFLGALQGYVLDGREFRQAGQIKGYATWALRSAGHG